MKLDGFLLCMVFCTILCFSCGDREDFVPKSSFIKIYNDESFESSYIPMDIVQADGSGYFILSSYNVWDTYVIRVDEQGEFLWDLQLEDNLINPVKGLYYTDSAFYFFCMDDLSLATNLIKITDQSQQAEVVRTYGNIVYPLYSSSVSDGYLIQSYDRESYSTKLTKLNLDFSIRWEEGYEVEQDVEQAIIGHLTRTRERLPFFTGDANGKYFVNGFYNFSLSLLFVDADDGSQTGVINGFRSESAISSADHLGGNNFAMSRFEFGGNFIIPKIEINTSGTGISSDLGGNVHPEMISNAHVHSEIIAVNGKEVTLYATTTKANQILLYAYDPSDGTLIGTHHLGSINSYSAIDFVTTNDGGLAILGNTFVSGRFSRITLFKLSMDQLMDFTY